MEPLSFWKRAAWKIDFSRKECWVLTATCCLIHFWFSAAFANKQFFMALFSSVFIMFMREPILFSLDLSVCLQWCQTQPLLDLPFSFSTKRQWACSLVAFISLLAWLKGIEVGFKRKHERGPQCVLLPFFCVWDWAILEQSSRTHLKEHQICIPK